LDESGMDVDGRQGSSSSSGTFHSDAAKTTIDGVYASIAPKNTASKPLMISPLVPQAFQSFYLLSGEIGN
jgi:hypothetical protein